MVTSKQVNNLSKLSYPKTYHAGYDKWIYLPGYLQSDWPIQHRHGMYVCMYVCMYIILCMHIHMYICTYIVVYEEVWSL